MKNIQIPDFLTQNLKFSKIQCVKSTDMLVGIELSGKISYQRVKYSIHYRCLQSSFSKKSCDEYNDYIRQQGRINTVENFISLYNSIKDGGFKKDHMICVLWSDEHKRWLVLDGFHRLAILTYLNSDKCISVVVMKRKWIKRVFHRLFRF